MVDVRRRSILMVHGVALAACIIHMMAHMERYGISDGVWDGLLTFDLTVAFF